MPQSSCEKRKNRTGEMEEENEGEGMGGEQNGREGGGRGAEKRRRWESRWGKKRKGEGECRKETEHVQMEEREQQGMVENYSTNPQSNATQKDRKVRPESLHHVIQHLQHHKSQLLKQ